MAKILDLFSGEGGSALGYARAGHDVEGVDNDPARLRKYPYKSHLGDAIEFLLKYGERYDFAHMSPTCTGYSRGTAAIPDRFTKYPRLIAAARAAAQEVGIPFVIENVEGARSELLHPITLCWTMFREPGSVLDEDGTPLQMYRHRLFETGNGFHVPQPEHSKHNRSIQVAGAYGGARSDKTEARYIRQGGYVPKSHRVLTDLMEIRGMTTKGFHLAIPPVYTEYIGSFIQEG